MGEFIGYANIKINGNVVSVPVMESDSGTPNSMLNKPFPLLFIQGSSFIIPSNVSGNFSVTIGNEGERITNTVAGNGYESKYVNRNGRTVFTQTIAPIGISRTEGFGIVLSYHDGDSEYQVWEVHNNISAGGTTYATVDSDPTATNPGSFRIISYSGAGPTFNYRDFRIPIQTGYTITFQTNGGTPVTALEEQTNLPDPLPVTTRENYIFTGWYTDSSLIFPAIPGAEITDDTTLYAGWRPEYPGPGGTTGGGEGERDETSDEIETSDPPLTDVTNTKFLTLWEATATQLDALAADLWSTAFNTGILKNQRDPFEALISLKQIPVPPDQIAAGSLKIGNYTPNPAITMTRIKQYKQLYCGSVAVPEFWGNALDYNGGGTRLEIYLPYIGTRELDPDDFMGGRCHVTYNVDMLTGACVAEIRAERTDADSGALNSVLYTFSGVCGVEIPLSGSTHSITVGNIIAGIAAAGGAVVSVATGGMALPALGAVAGAAGSIAANANKKTVSRTGGISQNAGIMSPQKPYLIISRPVQHTPGQMKKFSGFPAYITDTLGNLSGFTKVFRVHVDFTATEAERTEIENLLREGVIL